VEHVSGATLDPLADVQLINDELAIKDLAVLEKLDARLKKRDAGSREREIAQQAADVLGNGGDLAALRASLTASGDRALFDSLRLLSAKPQILVCNVGENDVANGGNELSRRITDKYENSVVMSGKLESDIASMEMSKGDASAMLAEFGVKTSGFNVLVGAAMRHLRLATYYTVGPEEARSWLFADGSTAAQCAGIIHTDFEKKFVKAEVISFDDLVKHGGEAAAKSAGALRFEGPKVCYACCVCLSFINVALSKTKVYCK
jgi:ribosome-binding ATPase YchF (GTP1/OBG family)